jgi:hypothetical protein
MQILPLKFMGMCGSEVHVLLMKDHIHGNKGSSARRMITPVPLLMSRISQEQAAYGPGFQLISVMFMEVYKGNTPENTGW